ncbi:probable serine/threonine-protein kinase At1g54610 [Lactuca sativa]|uniref:Protein kinase domain-containing protein n=1 Tax=Lactuca sativa TaxID=4236 RepID=A0A9R1WJ70_LACSA|nr:probable serine/threonine-protein kinase At1g54610 [Lactuca sativa]KAJ0223421.1 hypothetical protein LSAT_V11C200082640 [Lactuca sativa]
MGCISSKHVVIATLSPIHDSSLTLADDDKAARRFPNPNQNQDYGQGKFKQETEDDDDDDKISNDDDPVGDVVVQHSPKKPAFSLSTRFGRSTVAEHVAAGWPAWLSAVAGEAIDGWVPQKSDNFERFEKIGQGTYSSVYRARDLRSGKMMALKKVRFDNFQPESVRFMAREISILRRLDHQNVMKLEGIITSRLSCNIYLVFEYMEHDLAGLISSPDIRFTESQIKCYMRQLLKGIEHCHSRGILHRDIKTSNILVDNNGRLKIADFGLANFAASRQPLTSRVVTLWYRPPELLLGSSNYGTNVDMWSVGCVFAELFIGRPILKGRTEVEQLHKIFMLCGNPPDEFWKNSSLTLATMFKPRHAYESSLRERCNELPKSAVNLIASFLSVEPEKRMTATSALQSEYFHSRPYACDPTSLPTYPPSKEIDAKFREEANRKNASGRIRASGGSRNVRRGRQSTLSKVVQSEARRTGYLNGSRASADNLDTVSDVSQTADVSESDTICSLPPRATSSHGSLGGWSTKRRKHVSFVTPTSQDVRSFEPIYEQDLSSTSSDHQEQEEETKRYSGPMLRHAHTTNGRQEGNTRNGVHKSRFSRDAELLLCERGEDEGQTKHVDPF